MNLEAFFALVQISCLLKTQYINLKKPILPFATSDINQ